MRTFIWTELKDSYNVFTAHDGRLGLEKSYDEIPDAIISDVMMPGMTGFRSMQNLKK